MNDLLFNNEIIESLIEVAGDILEEEFHKKKYTVVRFAKIARDRLSNTHKEILEQFPKNVKEIFWANEFTKANFTVDTALVIIYDVLKTDFHFSYEAIYDFGKFISQHITVVEVDE